VFRVTLSQCATVFTSINPIGMVLIFDFGVQLILWRFCMFSVQISLSFTQENLCLITGQYFDRTVYVMGVIMLLPTAVSARRIIYAHSLHDQTTRHP
jgi:hypothetical protein